MYRLRHCPVSGVLPPLSLPSPTSVLPPLSLLTYQCTPSSLSLPSPTSVLPPLSLSSHLPVYSLLSLSPLTYRCTPSLPPSCEVVGVHYGSITSSYMTIVHLYRDNTWLGFGLSGSTSGTQMIGSDVSIVWVDDEDGAQAVDYHLSAYTPVCEIYRWRSFSIPSLDDLSPGSPPKCMQLLWGSKVITKTASLPVVCVSTKCRKIKCNSKHKKIIFVFSVQSVSLSAVS